MGRYIFMERMIGPVGCFAIVSYGASRIFCKNLSFPPSLNPQAEVKFWFHFFGGESLKLFCHLNENVRKEFISGAKQTLMKFVVN